MEQQVKDIMLEHLKTLKETAEDCEENQINSITNAMISTAEFLIKPRKEIPQSDETDSDDEE